MLKYFSVLIAFLALLGNVDLATNGSLYPRETVSRQTRNLDGLWLFRADYSLTRDAGFREKWFLKPLSESGDVVQMAVPSSFNDITQDEALRTFVGWVWYERTLFVHKSWMQGQRVVLRFDSVHYNAIVWVNGNQAMSHSGGHLPFQSAINNVLKPDALNRITVAVNNTLTPTTLPPGSIQHMTGPRYPANYFVQDYTFDFFNYAGIHRSVRLYTTPLAYIADVTITTTLSGDLSNGVLKFNTSLGFPATPNGRPTSQMKYELFDEGGKMVVNLTGVGLLHGVLSVADVMPWWPVGMASRTAYLYQLKITATTDDMMDVYTLPVGFRTVTVEKTHFLINNKPFYFKGVNMHEDSEIRGKGFDYALTLKNFNLLEWLGANSFRTSHYPYAEEIMLMADQRGIVIIDECPGVGIGRDNFGPESLAHHMEVMEELIRRDKNHPSVVMWSVANEPSSQLSAAEPYFKSVISHTRQLDSTRPVTFVNDKSPTTDRVVQFVDVICHNHYYSWYEDCGQLELIQRQLEYDVRQWYTAFEKPYIQSEYGAGAIPGLHMNPPLMFTEDYQVAAIKEYHPVFDKLRKEFMIGELIWNFADFMTKQGIARVVGNRKGILTRNRQPKEAAYVLRERYLNLNLSRDTEPRSKSTLVQSVVNSLNDEIV